LSQPSVITQVAAALLREAVATTVMPLFRNLKAGQVHEKTPGDYITQADEDCEAFMIPRLQALSPGSRVLGEEGISKDPRILSGLSAPHVWVLDPVDGTLLFKNGETKFGALLASVRNGKVESGIVLEVYTDPRGRIQNRVIGAEDGRGAWISEREGAPWVTLPPFAERPATDTALIDSHYFVPGFLRQDGRTDLRWIDQTAASARSYSEMARSGLDIDGIAPAHADAYVSAPARWWDHLAGSLMVRALGGVARTLATGRDYGTGSMAGGIVAARDAATADRALQDSCNGEMLRRQAEPCAVQHLVKLSTDSSHGIPASAYRDRSGPSRTPA
jgi:fructose-1,6-bisphosphatase/inositol monophosphatase family enzyme